MSVNINSFSNYNFLTNIISPIRRGPAFGASVTNPITSDSFAFNNELSPFLSVEAVQRLMFMNPKVSKILMENGISQDINIKELEKLANGHLKATKTIASGIIENLLDVERAEVNRKAVLDAAIYHDFGKVLIPAKILNKKGALSEQEKKIMELHSELGYELLKTQNISPKTLELIKYHHQNATKSGYPKDIGDFEYGIEAEILAIADKYSALTEKRAYKPALSPQEALEIIRKENSGSLAFDALAKYVATQSHEVLVNK